MSNIAGLFHPWEREPERGGWIARRVAVRRGAREPRERVQRREERRSISVPPPSPFRHSHFSPRSALHHSASHPPSFIPLSSPTLLDTVPWFPFLPCPSPPRSVDSALRRLQDPEITPPRGPPPATTAILIALSKFISETLVGGLVRVRPKLRGPFAHGGRNDKG